MIRKIKVTDYPRLMEIWESAVLSTHDFLKEEDFIYYKGQLPVYFQYVNLFGFEQEGTLIGFMGIAEGNLEMLFIDNNYRGTGVGKKLITYAIDNLQVTKVDVNEQNIPDAIRRVIGFYPMKMTVGDSLITVECIRKGERKLIGRLMDNHNLPVEFANVQLLSAKDSSFLCGGVSNANGDFVIPCEQKQAIMKVSYVGYKTISRLVTIGRMGIIRMQADAYQLKRVVVKGNLRTDRGDHARSQGNGRRRGGTPRDIPHRDRRQRRHRRAPCALFKHRRILCGVGGI